jgi:hypothetical protein
MNIAGGVGRKKAMWMWSMDATAPPQQFTSHNTRHHDK